MTDTAIACLSIFQGWNASYSESPNWPPPEDNAAIGQGSPYFRTQNNQAQVSITFEGGFLSRYGTLLHTHGTCIGTGLVMCYTDGGAQTALSLDGDAQIIRMGPASSDPVCKDSGASTVAYATGLDLKSHTAVLRVAASAEHETRFMGGLVSSSGGHLSWAHAAFRSRWPSTPQGMCTSSQCLSLLLKYKRPNMQVVDRWVDDTDPLFVYQPGAGPGGVYWDRGDGKAPTAHNSTSTFNCGWASDHSVTTTFTGEHWTHPAKRKLILLAGAGAAILWGYAWRDSHDYQVDISGGEFSDSIKGDLSTTGWMVGQAVMWAHGNLDPSRTYTVTLRNFSEDNDKCEGYQVVPEGQKGRQCCSSLDGLQLFSGEAAPPGCATCLSRP